ncbi:mannosyltransferase putative-domain-containing protein [Mortierella sp. GBAus27b]|nr:mannosyltransferase putative-domain-containing protein [Mortierella sp. GBAus27b]
MAELSRAERIYKALWNHVYPIYLSFSGKEEDRENKLLALTKTRPEVDFFLKLEKRLYPWAFKGGRRTSFSLHRSYKGRGIVICAGNPQFEFVITSILAIRNRLKSALPIQIFHMGNDDLSVERQTYLKELTTGIEIVDVTHILDNDHMSLSGWAIKPFAMLASSFEEVMFVDADAYFLQDPAVLFDDPGYLATGALFFYDRTLFPDWPDSANWVSSILPIMSSFPPKSRLFNFISAHEQESGVVVINKRTRFTGMMSICKMNGRWERELHSYAQFHGDKETFWVGMEMVQEPYAFVRNHGGAIGELRPGNDKSVCGAQLHEDHQGRPLWWNGGLWRNKNEADTRNLDFGYWMSGGGHQTHRERFTRNKESMINVLMDLNLGSSDELELEPQDAAWDFKESCLEGATVHTLTQREKDLANGYVAIDKIAREDGRKLSAGEHVDPKQHNWDAATA